MLPVIAKVLVFDASALQCELLTAGLESMGFGFVVRSANDLKSITDVLSNDPSWVVVLSDSTPGNDSINTAKALRVRFQTLLLVFLLTEGRLDRVIEAFRVGARGIVYSNEGLSQLAGCISRVHQGEIYVRDGDLSTILDGLLKPGVRVTDSTGRALLSPREDEISRLVAEGMSNREVARALKISESTVKNSLFHVFEKLGISNRVELTRYVNGASEPKSRAFQ